MPQTPAPTATTLNRLDRVLFEVDLAGRNSGIVRLGATSAQPFRAALLGLAVDELEHSELAIADENPREKL